MLRITQQYFLVALATYRALFRDGTPPSQRAAFTLWPFAAVVLGVGDDEGVECVVEGDLFLVAAEMGFHQGAQGFVAFVATDEAEAA